MTDFVDWKTFDYNGSSVQLWVFKKSTTSAKFRAWHVRTDDAIEQLFRDAINGQVASTTEQISYTPISQNNESSCLTYALEESEGLAALLTLVDAPESENTDIKLEQLKGAAGYIVKFQHNNNTVYAVRKTSPGWRPKVRNTLINAVFNNGELSAESDEVFTFDQWFDFFCLNETIFVKKKSAFESVLSEKKVYRSSFEKLSIDPQFTSIFADIQPLKDYVGTNAIQLRRIAVIQNKALYLKPGFNKKVRSVSATRNFGLNFDANDKLIVCSATVKTIMQILLDHRLFSEITDTIYDVPDAEAV